MSEALSLQGFLSPGNGGTEGGVKTIEAGREVDCCYEKGNLENNYSVDHLCFDRSSYHSWCDKLHVACARQGVLKEK